MVDLFLTPLIFVVASVFYWPRGLREMPHSVGYVLTKEVIEDRKRRLLFNAERGARLSTLKEA